MAVGQTTNQKTIQQIIDQSSSNSASRKTGDLGKDDFLNLMVTQLRYQDPLNPTDDKEFIGQMAQFSSLEQMQNLNTSMSSMKAFNLMGKRVTASIIDPVTKAVKAVEGEVSSVKVSSGKAYVVVKGQDISVDDIVDISDGLGTSTSNLSQYTSLIGYKADAAVYDPDSGDMIGVNGTIKALQKGVYEDYAVMDGVDVEIAEIVSSTKSTDPNYIKNYLNSNNGKTVDVVIINRTTGKKVPVTGTLVKDSLTITADGKFKAKLDNLNVPVESIANVTPVQKTSNEEALLKSILDKLSATQNTTAQSTAAQNSTNTQTAASTQHNTSEQNTAGGQGTSAEAQETADGQDSSSSQTQP